MASLLVVGEGWGCPTSKEDERDDREVTSSP
jgi:hypothetical protein